MFGPPRLPTARLHCHRRPSRVRVHHWLRARYDICLRHRMTSELENCQFLFAADVHDSHVSPAPPSLPPYFRPSPATPPAHHPTSPLPLAFITHQLPCHPTEEMEGNVAADVVTGVTVVPRADR